MWKERKGEREREKREDSGCNEQFERVETFRRRSLRRYVKQERGWTVVALLRVQGSPFTRDSIDNRGLSVDRAEPGTKRATGHLGDQALQEFVARFFAKPFSIGNSVGSFISV